MSELLRQNNLAETVATTAQLDAVCDRFEAAWRSETRPSLEGFLAELPEAVHTRGFRELLDVELAYRQKSGEPVSADEYLARFPQQAAIVNQLFCRSLEHPRRLGDYELLEVIGQGAMGVVYKARHMRLNRMVAVKVLPDRLLGHKQLLARFQQEMQSIGRLNHRNIVQAFDAREESGVPVLVMEFIDGISLDKLVAQGPVAPADACELIRQAATGLQHAHEQGLVHRDIKPSNLILSRSGEVKIVDFGLARLNEDRLSIGLTNSQQALGTLDYMAPEQFDSASRADIHADIYSLGCTLFNLLAGCPPFPAPQYSSFASKMRAHCMAVVPQVNVLRPDVPAELANILERMMAKRPADRFATPADVAKALEPYATGGQSVILAHDGSFTANLSAAQASAPTNSFLLQPSTETDRPGKSSSSSISSLTLLSRVRSKRMAIGVAVAALVALTAGLWALLSRNDHRGAENHSPAHLSLEQVFGTLPGLTGDWWFDETPWLIPHVRQRLLTHLQKIDTKKDGSDEGDLQKRISELEALLNGSDVFEFQGQLESLATDFFPSSNESEREEITKLCSLLETSENLGADYKSLEKVRDTLLQKAHPIHDAAKTPDLENDLEKLSAADCHLLAVVLQRMAMNSNVSALSDVNESGRLEAAPTTPATTEEKKGEPTVSSGEQRDLLWTKCKQAYEAALEEYEKVNDQTMQAVCHADLAQMYFEQGRYQDAVDNFRLAQTSLPSPRSPLFEAFVLCGQADAYCQLSKYSAAYVRLEEAEKIVDTLPKFHPMRAVVAEHTAWYYMNRHYLDAKARSKAEGYFESAIEIRQQNEKSDPRASRDRFHDQHGEALSLQYRGVFKRDAEAAEALAKSKSKFKEILKELTGQLDDPSKIYERKPDLVTAKMIRDLVQRAINSMEREADGYLFGSPHDFKTAADHYLGAYEFLKNKGLDRNVEASTAVNLLFKRTMALSFAGEIEAAEKALMDADLLFDGLKSENEPLAFVRTVATSAVKFAKHDQTSEQVRDQFVPLFVKKVNQDDQQQVPLLRDERLEFDILKEQMNDPTLFEKASAAALETKGRQFRNKQ